MGGRFQRNTHWPARKVATSVTKYIDGQVYAMTGASDRHCLITGNICAVLRPLLRGTPCQLFANDMKMRLNLNQRDIFYYPDLLLSCDPTDRETYYRTKPCLLVEVLSDATARLVSREKRFACQTLPSMREYLLVSQARREVQMFPRQEEWVLDTCRAGQVRLDCPGFELPLDLIYEDVPEL
jgi:Uma2 family endonuclease